MKTKLLLSVFLFGIVLNSSGQWTYKNLSAPKDRIGAAVLGTKAYFGGGEDEYLNPVSTVEIYDVEKEDWETIPSFQVPRMHPAGIACGTKIIFAGGGDINTAEVFDNVDIWDTVTKQWTYEYLTIPRIFLSVVCNGNKVLFAGGTNFQYDYDVVDIYDVSTGTWTSATLSVPRSCMAAAVTGDQAFFAGGYKSDQTVTDIVDIYNFTSNTWSTAVLSQARAFLTAVALGDIVMFAGGTDANNIASDRVDIYNRTTGLWTTDKLSVPRALFPEPVSAAVCSKAYFVGGGYMDLYSHVYSSDIKVIDIYDVNTGLWSVDSLTEVKIMYAVAGVDDHLIVAGGYNGNELSNVDIYIDPYCTPPIGIDPNEIDTHVFSIYPNPTSGIIHLELPDKNVQNHLLATLYNMQGQVVFTQTLASSDRDLNLNLPAGMYLLKVVSDDAAYKKLITIQN